MMQQESLGVSNLIVKTLREYGTIPVDFLAKVLGRRTPEILDYLGVLEKKGVIKREGENVGLAPTKVKQ